MQTFTISTSPGAHIATDPRLAYVHPLLVTLEGTSYDIRLGGLITASLRQVIYEPGRQGVRFSSDVLFSPGAKIFVMYKL